MNYCKSLSLRLASLCFCFLVARDASAQSNWEERLAWNKQVEPFRIAGNLYYVGTEGVSSFLITDAAGTVLLDGGFEETAPLIERSVVKLGFSVRQIRYLISSHAHYDHCGGFAKLKRDSGAKMISSEADRWTLESGQQDSFGTGQRRAVFPAIHVDQTIRDGERIDSGAIHLKAVLTPGHTKGCTTWTMPVTAGPLVYQVVFHCSETVAGNDLVNNKKYPEIVRDYEKTFAATSALKCDIFLAPHPSFFHLEEKRQRLQHGDKNAFVNPAEVQAFNQQMKKAFDDELQRQKELPD